MRPNRILVVLFTMLLTMMFFIPSYQAPNTNNPIENRDDCVVLINESFENGFPPENWTNTGWIDSMYGCPYHGDHWALSWSPGSELTTPPLEFGMNTTLTFWYRARNTVYHEDLEVYVNDTLVWSDYDFTHVDYEMGTVCLESFFGLKTISFYDPSSKNGIGTNLDLITVTTSTFAYVDDDFNSSTPGWQIDHFDVIQDGIDAVPEGGTVYVYNGTYYEVIMVNKPLDLTGENRDTTIIDGGYGLNVIHMALGNSTINNFTILNCVDGIDIRADDCIIDNNKIMQSTNGIRIHNSYNNIISNNTISNNTDGISVVSSDNNSIIENMIKYNNDDGIRLYDSTNNLITLNTISDNQLSGIEISLSTNNNTIYHNNLVNNNPNAICSDENTNIWDNGYPSGGNYWGDYTGSDADGDGIGDTPYNISGGDNQDHYPFMHPYGWLIELDINQDINDRGFPIRHAADGDWAGAQNFTPNYDQIAYTEIYLRKFGTPEFNLTVELRENHPQGNLIDALTFTPDEVPSNWEWFPLDFQDTVITSDTSYFIVIPPAPNGVTTSFGYEWGYAWGDQYWPGSLWFTRDGGGLWRDLPTMYEFAFRTFGYD